MYAVREMADALSSSDFRAALDCVRAVHAVDDVATLPMLMLRAAAKIVRAKVVAFTQVDPVLGESSGCLLPPGPFTVEWVAPRFQAHIADHPVVQHSQRLRDGSARAISDFLTQRQFHATGLYREVFQPMGIEDQLSIGMVGSAGLMIGLSFNRASRGFSLRDRAVLNLLRPHLLQAYVSCRERQLLRNADGIRRGTIVDRLPVGLICVDTKGAVVWATEPVRPMLAEHFPEDTDSIHGLPHVVRVWLKSKSKTGVPLISSGPENELHIRRCPLKGGHDVLLLQRHRPTAASAAPLLDAYGFTAREADVMRTLLAGSTAAQAAAKLSISPRTIHKHLQRIFRKTGVNSLSAACVKLLGPA